MEARVEKLKLVAGGNRAPATMTVQGQGQG